MRHIYVIRNDWEGHRVVRLEVLKETEQTITTRAPGQKGRGHRNLKRSKYYETEAEALKILGADLGMRIQWAEEALKKAREKLEKFEKNPAAFSEDSEMDYIKW